ncbi:hypothetical protein QFC22_001465 [Naganishia vaughanmartiniae]|uniref:Uncharacterized protein n=1 Tax=Naganishia vaughanmartiniae TaxID=1424756 RepID=A0ACC2XJ12_9TREE|nr:hypothetical protein QFC22_001465 [Naganishia vaughanmartiniae]
MSAWQSLVENLTSPDAMENDPHTVAIGLEMESLAAIYGEDACRLHTSEQGSRPSSIISAKDRPTPGSSRAGSPPRSATMNGKNGTTGLENTLANLQVNDELVNLAAGKRLRYEIVLPLFAPDDPSWRETQHRISLFDSVPIDEDDASPPPLLRILVSLGPHYPSTAPPQLQLLGRYIGQFSMDADLFGSVTKTYISSNGVPFTAGDVCVFEGINYVLEVSKDWYLARIAERIEGERMREAGKDKANGDGIASNNHEGPTTTFRQSPMTFAPSSWSPPPTIPLPPQPTSFPSFSSLPLTSPSLPLHIKIHSSPPITVSKSVFIGHACRVTNPFEVPLVIHHLLSDKKIAKAAHPVIHAYRIVKDQEDIGKPGQQVIVADNDDDGETAAGGRLAHLLQILPACIVRSGTRKQLLGPERFKLINQAARDALEIGGFLPDKAEDASASGSGKDKNRRGRK